MPRPILVATFTLDGALAGTVQVLRPDLQFQRGRWRVVVETERPAERGRVTSTSEVIGRNATLSDMATECQAQVMEQTAGEGQMLAGRLDFYWEGVK